eukprot:TRINITY_DN7693_c0_g1_i1.p1 TRINITY_DN7693_c0_g1~~TRINITY_DN7693_c0_g1_i1.p1  ORF type:complete len:935 (+),score=412.42 TRINITY_DN7693_c0_g1_i1:139-2805(+)
MVQASNFDRKIPAWHHLKCLFAKGHNGLTDFKMIKNRDAIRLNDQEEIKTLIIKYTPESGDAQMTEGSDNSKKRKAEDCEEESAKKQKTDVEIALEEENKILWEIKDYLKDFRTSELKAELAANNQPATGGEQDIITRFAERILFGSLPKCSKCQSNLTVEAGIYKCSGFDTAWSRCDFTSQTVEYTKFEISFDDVYLSKIQRRQKILIKSEVVRSTPTEETTESAKKKREFHNIGVVCAQPLGGKKISLMGFDKAKKATMESLVNKLGGKVSPVSIKVSLCIATKDAAAFETSKVAAATKKAMENVIKFDIPILGKDFLYDSVAEGKKLDLLKYLIGGSDYAKSTIKYEYSADDVKTEPVEKKVKLIKKGRAAVDPLAGDDSITDYHVLDKDNNIYNAVLNCTDISTNINSYYGLQALKHDKREDYRLFRKWGRVGTEIGGSKVEQFSTEWEAVNEFKRLYLDKTGNQWSMDKDSFEKSPGKFYPIDIDYGDEEESAIKTVNASSNSKLDRRVQDLVTMIFDIKMMEKSLMEMEIDLKKMPLGKLSKKHIQSGYQVLNKISEALKALGKGEINEEERSALDKKTEKKLEVAEEVIAEKEEKEEKEPKATGTYNLLALSNQFYTMIPHDFGSGPVKMIDSIPVLKEKIKMMEALIEIEIATSLMKKDGAVVEGEDPLDASYKKLKTGIEPLDKTDPEFIMAEKYALNQKGSYKLKVNEVYKIDREGEEDRFEPSKALGNRQLLWHGSRTTNYVGILSQGLRIAPPEAPKSGYRFGKGVYFADICEKSVGYCRGAGSNEVLMMLVDVSLGNMAELTKDQYMEKPLPGHNSTKALGGIAPDDTMTTSDGVVVPYGKPKNTGIRSYCTHNEYIIYDIKQANIKYLCKIQLL